MCLCHIPGEIPSNKNKQNYQLRRDESQSAGRLSTSWVGRLDIVEQDCDTCIRACLRSLCRSRSKTFRLLFSNRIFIGEQAPSDLGGGGGGGGGGVVHNTGIARVETGIQKHSVNA